MKPLKYFSLFTGIGGFELGILQAYESNHRSKSKKGTARHARGWKPADRMERDAVPVCVGYSEIDKYAIQIYQKHYPTHKNYGDITKIDEKALPDFDILFGGFPCQSFSIAGKRKGFEDTRGTLFFDICRIAKEKQPRLIFLENVKGLLSHDEGRTFTTIIAALDELGYDLQWQVLNSKDFGVPQNRERIFIVGHLRGTSRPEVFPIASDSEADFVLPTLTSRYYGAQANGGYISHEQKKDGRLAYALKARHDGGIDKKHPQTLVIGTYRTQKDGQGFREMKEGISPTIQARARNDGSGQPVISTRARGNNKGSVSTLSPTIGSHSWDHNNHLHLEQGGVRRLTPKECERLQGLPDDWTADISDSQRYKCLGNAVTVNVIQAIAEKFI